MEFLNKFGKKLSGAAKSMTELTKDGVESTKLSLDLRNARGDLEEMYTALGKQYYAVLSGNSEAVSDDLVARIKATTEHMNALISQKEERARQQQISEQSRCPGCGAVQLPSSRFCANCGRRMPEQAPAVAPVNADYDTEYCESCGAMRTGDEKYCAVCGFSFEKTDLLPEAEPAEEETPTQKIEGSEAPDSFDCE